MWGGVEIYVFFFSQLFLSVSILWLLFCDIDHFIHESSFGSRSCTRACGLRCSMSSTSTGVCAIEGQIWWVRCSSPSCCFGHGTSSASISPPSLALTPTFSVSLFTTSISLFLVFLREKSHHLPLCHLQLNLLSIRQSRCHSRSHYCLIHLSCKVCCYSSVTNQIVLKVQAVSQQIVTWPYHWLLKKDLNCFYLFECVPESPWILNILSPFFFFFLPHADGHSTCQHRIRTCGH